MKLVSLLFILCWPLLVQSQSMPAAKVEFNRNDSLRKVDVYIDGKYFTSYIYLKNLEKPILFPVIATNGSCVTRGFPLLPRAGERIDHPHHIGLWFNYGDVNGIDFWNNSYAIPADKKNVYGSVIHKDIRETRVENGKGWLGVNMAWTDQKGNLLLKEETEFIFSGDEIYRRIERHTKLTALIDQVIFKDSKEGMIAIRVDRAFEAPSSEPLVFTDASGNESKVPVLDNTGVNGIYKGSNGLSGDSVWGTRNSWVSLTAVKDNTIITLAFFDHPGNPGYPAYAHARGYGLFALNNLGQKSFNPAEKPSVYILRKGESFNFRHLFVIRSGSALDTAEAKRIAEEFASSK